MNIDDIKIDPKWEKSSEEIWLEKFSTLKDVKKPSKKLPLFTYFAAASVIIFAIFTSFAFLYTKKEISERGVHLAVMLPDNSKVQLNAESELTYKPLWWYISREVKLSGEAYFEVEKGKRFSVISSQNSVHVLGTSFNVFSRKNKYSVTCLTGKVEVVSNREKVILLPDMSGTVHDGKFIIAENSKPEQAISWTDNKFYFIGIPLSDVIEEIERQYNINITTSSKLNYLYTGTFSKAKNPQEVLDIIGETFDITFGIKK